MKEPAVKATVLGAILVISALAFPHTSRAFSCPVDTETCNGNEYAVSFDNIGGDIWEATFEIMVLPTYTGNQWDDVINAVQLKDFTSDPIFLSAVSLTAAPSGTGNWSLFSNELSNGSGGGCTGGSGSSNNVCIQWIGDGGIGGWVANDILTWVFEFESPNDVFSSNGAHIKYLYQEYQYKKKGGEWKKIGSLGSFDVPEPSPLALMGLALFLLGAFGRTRWHKASMRIG